MRWDRGPNLPDQAVLVDLRALAVLLLLHRDLAAGSLLLHRPADSRLAGAVPVERAVRPRLVRLFLPADGVDRPVPTGRALVEGDRRERMKLDAAPWTADKIAKRVAKHAFWLLIAWWTGGAWVLYFADAPTLVRELVDVAGARRRLCLDRHLDLHDLLPRRAHARAGLHLHVPVAAHPGGADRRRCAQRHLPPRPRRTAHVAQRGRRLRAAGQPAGDCIDCDQCVAVCPTGVDIRNGSQLGCIQCGLCIDACDAVMAKVHRPTRLITYDTDENMQRRQRGEAPVYRLVRSRTILYVVVMAIVGSLMLYQLTTRSNLASACCTCARRCTRPAGQNAVRNGYTLRFSNKWSEPPIRDRHRRRQGRDGQERAGRRAARRAPRGRRRSRLDRRKSSSTSPRRAPRLTRPACRSSMTATDLDERRERQRQRPLLRPVRVAPMCCEGLDVDACQLGSSDGAARLSPTSRPDEAADRPPRGDLARAVLRRDVRRQRRVDLHRAQHAARRGAGDLLRREPESTTSASPRRARKTSWAGSPT